MRFSCPICKEIVLEFGDDRLSTLIRCGHVFHETCLMTWHLNGISGSTCPTCRTPCVSSDIIRIYIMDNEDPDPIDLAPIEERNVRKVSQLHEEIGEKEKMIRKLQHQLVLEKKSNAKLTDVLHSREEKYLQAKLDEANSKEEVKRQKALLQAETKNLNNVMRSLNSCKDEIENYKEQLQRLNWVKDLIQNGTVDGHIESMCLSPKECLLLLSVYKREVTKLQETEVSLRTEMGLLNRRYLKLSKCFEDLRNELALKTEQIHLLSVGVPIPMKYKETHYVNEVNPQQCFTYGDYQTPAEGPSQSASYNIDEVINLSQGAAPMQAGNSGEIIDPQPSTSTAKPVNQLYTRGNLKRPVNHSLPYNGLGGYEQDFPSLKSFSMVTNNKRKKM